MKTLLLAGLLLPTLAGCDSTTEPSEFTNTVFTLVDATLPPSAGPPALVPDFIEFAPDGQIVVNSCNRCEGAYEWRDNELVVSGLGCTEIACGDRFDLGVWLDAERIVVSDTDTDEVTLVAERGGEIATFLFTIAER